MHRTEAEAIAAQTLTIIQDCFDYIDDQRVHDENDGNLDDAARATLLIQRLDALRRFIASGE